MTTLRKTAAFVALATVLTVAAATPALAQAACATRDKIVMQLAKTYQEKPVSLGLTASGGLLEVLVSPKGSWTILITRPNGPTCVLSHGQDWNERKLVADGPLA